MSLNETGTLGGATTQTTDAGGVATFNDLSIDLVGSKTLTAGSGALVVSSSFVISPAAASQLDFVQQPSNAVAGESISPAVTVQLKDQFGNNVPQAGVSVAMALSSGT